MRPDPNILAFDTSAAHCAAALLSSKVIFGAQTVAMEKGQAEYLMGLLQDTLAVKSLRLQDLDAIAVGTGPGNFTGIRISVAAARGLSTSLGIPAIGVSMFEAMAFEHSEQKILTSLAAPRGQVYVQPFENGLPSGAPRQIDPSHPPSEMVVCSGTHVIGVQADIIAKRFGCSATEKNLVNIPGSLAKIGAYKLHTHRGAIDRPAPIYVRAPDAAPPKDKAPTILPVAE